MDLDFLLGLVKHHRHSWPLHIQNLASLTLVLGLNYAHQVSRLEVLAHVSSVDVKSLCELGNPDRLERDLAALGDSNHSAFQSREVALQHVDLVSFVVDARGSCEFGLTQHVFNFFVVV